MMATPDKWDDNADIWVTIRADELLWDKIEQVGVYRTYCECMGEIG